MTPRKPPRRGFAMVLVLVFVTAILGSWGVAARHTSSLIRIEQARADRARRDATRSALARAVAALEAGCPPESPHSRSIPGDKMSFAVSFVRDSGDPSVWAVSAGPGGEGLPELDESLFK